jgi:shikimate dehydrogenase
VWGNPIDHSRSPDLHLACYRHLGIPGTYSKRLVTENTLHDSFEHARDTLTGVSLTMPLKTAILGLSPDHRGPVWLLGAANTAVRQETGWWLDNTDPLGASAMIRRLLPDSSDQVMVLGAGATAKSVIAGLAHTGFTGRVVVAARSAQRAQAAMDIATHLGLVASFHDIDTGETGSVADLAPNLVISTLPSGTSVLGAITGVAQATRAPLIDVGYHPWPTPLASAWQAAGLPAHSGLPMLMFQALAQIRCFLNGERSLALPDEAGALSRMADAVGVEAGWADPALMGQ